MKNQTTSWSTRMRARFGAFALALASTLGLLGCASAQARSEASMKDLEAIVGDATFVTFGETSHFMQGMHRFAAQAFRHLAETKGLRVFVFESAWGVEEALEDFFASDRAELTMDERFFLNAFQSPETTELLRWIRDFNRRHPDDKIRVAGYQPEQPITDFHALWAHAAKSKKFPGAGLKEKVAACFAEGTSSDTLTSNLEFFKSFFEHRRAGKPMYTPEKRAECLAGVAEIERFLSRNERELVAATSANAHREAMLHAYSLKTFIETISRAADELALGVHKTPEAAAEASRRSYDAIDEARFEIFQTLKQTRYGDKKMLLWMHNWHATKHSDEVEMVSRDGVTNTPKGTISFGTRMAKVYGDRLVTIGSVMGCASCTAPVRDDALAPKFAAVFGEGSALIDLRSHSPLLEKLSIDSPGSILEQHNQSSLVVNSLRRQFDAVYYLSESKRVGAQ